MDDVGLAAGRTQREKKRSYKDLLREEEETAAQVRNSSKKRQKDSDPIFPGPDTSHKKKKKSDDSNYGDFSLPDPAKKKKKLGAMSPPSDSAMDLLKSITPPVNPGCKLSKKAEKSPSSSSSSSSSFSPPGYPSYPEGRKEHKRKKSNSSQHLPVVDKDIQHKSKKLKSPPLSTETLTLREPDGLKMKLIVSPKEENLPAPKKSSKKPPLPPALEDRSILNLATEPLAPFPKPSRKKIKLEAQAVPPLPPVDSCRHEATFYPKVGILSELEMSCLDALDTGSSSGGELDAGDLVINDSSRVTKKKKKSKKSKKKKDKEKHREDRHRDDKHKEEKHKEDRHKEDKRKEDRRKEDKHKEEKRKEDKRKDDRHRDDRHRDDHHREDKHRDEKHKEEKDEKRKEEKHKEDRRKEDKHKEEKHKDEKRKEEKHKEKKHTKTTKILGLVGGEPVKVELVPSVQPPASSLPYIVPLLPPPPTPLPPPPVFHMDGQSEKKKKEKDEKGEKQEKPKKKNMTAYQVFCKEYRINIIADHPGLDFGELSKKLAEVWKQMADKDKLVWKQRAQYLQHKQNKAEATTVKRKCSSSEGTFKSRGSSTSPHKKSPSRLLLLSSSPVKLPETQPIDVAAHLQLLGESMSLIGHRLQETEGMVAVSGSLSVLLDSILCALGPLVCLSAQVPQLNICPKEVLSNTLDNIAYIMPGL